MDGSSSYRDTFASSGFCGLVLVAGLGIASVISAVPAQAQQMCGGVTYPFPYTDVSGVMSQFCPGIMEAYVTGISNGTTPTTFSPNDDVFRLQMTTFLQRTVDQVLARGSRRAGLNQWWTSRTDTSLQFIVLGSGMPQGCAADGEYIWTTTSGGNLVQIQASTGINVNHWTGATSAQGVVVAAGKVFVAGETIPNGSLYVFDPLTGLLTTANTNLGSGSTAIAFDGTSLWTTDQFNASVTKITPTGSPPYPRTIITHPAFAFPNGILYDGAHIWFTDYLGGKLFELDDTGAILNSVAINTPDFPAFDGANIWVPDSGGNSITVVRASNATVIATIASDGTNMLSQPVAASFDGERVLVTNAGNNTVTLFKAADLSFIANVSLGPRTPNGACSDGINFWLGANDLLRF